MVCYACRGVFPFRVIVLVSCFICVLVCSCSFLLVFVLSGVGVCVLRVVVRGVYPCRFDMWLVLCCGVPVCFPVSCGLLEGCGAGCSVVGLCGVLCVMGVLFGWFLWYVAFLLDCLFVCVRVMRVVCLCLLRCL